MSLERKGKSHILDMGQNAIGSALTAIPGLGVTIVAPSIKNAQAGFAGAFTVGMVEDRLVLAFRALPGHPALSTGSGYAVAAAPLASEALSWIKFVDDKVEAKALLTWARCRATLSSWPDQCRYFGIAVRTADCRRKRAATKIAAALNK